MSGKTRKSEIELTNAVALALAFVSALINRNLWLAGGGVELGVLNMGSWWGHDAVIRRIIPKRPKWLGRHTAYGRCNERQIVFDMRVFGSPFNQRAMITVHLGQNLSEYSGLSPWYVVGFSLQDPDMEKPGHCLEEMTYVGLVPDTLPFSSHRIRWTNAPGSDTEVF